MDVYFERIAGVADTRPQPPKSEAAPALPGEDEPIDEDGFPISPLRDQDHLWFVQASRLHRPLAGAASIARASGLSLMIMGAATAFVGILSVMTGGTFLPIVLGAILLTLGTMERSGAVAMAAANMRAPGQLARNQLSLLVIVVASAWVSGAGSELGAMLQELVQGGSVPQELQARMTALASVLSRGLVIPAAVVGLAVNGSLAVYYLTRKRPIGLFHRELPPWVVNIVTTVNGNS